jgi:ABC-type molybdate transport system substrate-binding protein
MTSSPSNPNAAHPDPLRGISSMATRLLLAELLADWQAQGGAAAAMESVGGVDAARRVQEGEAFDVIVLAANALSALDSAGKTVAGSAAALVRSGVSVAVPTGAPQPDISTEDALKAAVLAAPTLGYSTGPSGTHLLKTFERWGLLETVRPRIVQAPPGVPVHRLPASASEDRLLGGLDLAATLTAGRPVAQAGLLTQADGGIVVAAMAERMPAANAAHLCGALDRRAVRLERDGLAQVLPARVAVVALDESQAEDRPASAALADVLSGNLEASVGNFAGAPLNAIRSGRLRALGITSETARQRWTALRKRLRDAAGASEA